MTFRSYALDKFLPEGKEKYESFEEFYKKVIANIKYLQFKLPTEEELSEVLKTIYNLEDDNYVLIRKKVKMEYPLFRKNADIINEVILNEDDYITTLNNLIEIFKIRCSIVNRMVSNLIKVDTCASDIEKVLADVSSNDSVEIEVLNSQFDERTKNFTSNQYLLQYIDREKSGMQSEVVSIVQTRLSKKMLASEKENNANYNCFRKDCIDRTIRGHR